MENNLDALKMVRKIRDKHYEILSGKSKQEKIEFFKKKAQEFSKKTLKKLLN